MRVEAPIMLAIRTMRSWIERSNREKRLTQFCELNASIPINQSCRDGFQNLAVFHFDFARLG